jgi:hypothetical protein
MKRSDEWLAQHWKKDIEVIRKARSLQSISNHDLESSFYNYLITYEKLLEQGPAVSGQANTIKGFILESPQPDFTEIETSESTKVSDQFQIKWPHEPDSQVVLDMLNTIFD